jgi:stress response protein SCP2
MDKGNYDLSSDAVTIAIDWEADSNLDAGIGFFNSKNQLIDQALSFSNTSAYDHAVTHNGNNTGKEETIDIIFNRIPETVEYMMLVINTFDSSFTGVHKANALILEYKTKNRLCEITLDKQQIDKSASAYVLCKIYRYERVDGTKAWKMQPIVQPGAGRMIRDTLSIIMDEIVDTIDIPAKEWQTTLRVTKGRNLAAMDLNGKSDPYWILFEGIEKLHISQVQLKTLNPEWHPMDRVILKSDNADAIKTVRIEVWDEDKITQDDFMGQIESLQVGPGVGDQSGKWIDLQPRNAKDKKVKGQIEVNWTTTAVDIVRKEEIKFVTKYGNKL